MALEQRFVGQPVTGQVIDILAELVGSGRYDSLAASVAYAVSSGTDALVRKLDTPFGAMDKRWLVGIDWGRSQPAALDSLSALPNSQVGVFDGAAVLENLNCWPNVSYHPKGFALSSPDHRALLLGSANLSANGLQRGVEADFLLTVSRPRTQAEHAAWATIGDSLNWFDGLWPGATEWGDIRDPYGAIYPELRSRQGPAPTDDNAGPTDQVRHRRGFSPDDLVMLSSADRLWTEVPNLHENRGAGRPGSQLMMRALTRTFFGFEPRDLPKMSHVGTVDIETAGFVHQDRPLIYAHNGMDELNLPIPGQHGAPAAYDQETILFNRSTRGGRTVYELAVGRGRRRAIWRRRSIREGKLWTMPSGREFGVF